MIVSVRRSVISKVVAGLVIGIGGLSCALMALAFFTHPSSAGSNTFTAGKLNPPTGVTAGPASGATVPVSWTASATGGSAITPLGYYVQRLLASTPTAACGSDATHLITSGTACVDGNGTGYSSTSGGPPNAAVADGTYTYRVTAAFHSWTASGDSGQVTVATPVTSVTFTAGSVAANATSTWTVGFTTSASGQLAAGNTVTVTFNNNFTVPATPTITLPTGFSHCSATGSTTGSAVTITLANSGGTCALGSSTAATLTVAGVTNPAAATYAASTFSVATSQDVTAAHPASGVTITPTAVTGVTFAPGSAAANTTSTWAVGFTTSASGKLASGNTVTVTFNPNFTVPATPAITLPTGFAQCSATAGSSSGVVTITLANSGGTCALANSTAATLTVASITNPAAGTYVASTFSVATSQDVTAVSPASSVTITPTAVTSVTFTPGSAAANTTSTWTVGLTTSASGKLASGNTVTVTFNSNFTVPATPTITLPTGFSHCSATGSTTGSVVTITLANSGGTCTLGNSTAATLTVAGITNPAAGTYVASTFSVATSQDATAVNPASAVTITATSVSGVTFTPGSTVKQVTSTWTVGFTTSSAGQLAAGNTITVTFNNNFTVPATPTITLPTGFAHCSATATSSSGVVTITLANSGGTCALANSTAATLTVAGITNPAASTYAANTFSVATSQDAAAVNPAAAITIIPSSVTSVTFTPGSTVKQATSTWTVGFTTSASGQLASGNTITVTFNNNFTVPATPTITLPTGFSHCSATATSSSGVVTITLANTGGTCALANSTAATLTVAGITNPAAGTYAASTFSVATSQDATAVNPAAAITIIPSSVTSVTLTPGSAAANTTSTWTVGFTTSASGQLASGNTITVTFNNNFTVPATPTITLPTGFAHCSATATSSSGVVTITLVNSGGTCALANSTAATLTVAGITNPAAGTYAASTFSVATSQDATAVNPASAVTITATSVSSVTFAPGSTTPNATSTWTVGFTTSSTGQLAAGNTITVTFNNNFTVPATPTITLPTGFSHCSATATSSSDVVTITLASSGGTCALANSTAATLTVAGITNPGAGTYAANTFSVATSQDATAVNPASAVTITSATIGANLLGSNASSPCTSLNASHACVGPSVATTSGATELIVIYDAGSQSASINATSVTCSCFTAGATAVSVGDLSTSPHEFAYGSPPKNEIDVWVATGSGGTASSVTATFASNEATSSMTIGVIELSGNSLSTPIAQVRTNTATSSSATTTAFSTTPASGDAEIILIGTPSNVSVGTPASFTALFSQHGTGYGVGAFFNSAAQSTSSTSTLGGSALWGTIALDIAHA